MSNIVFNYPLDLTATAASNKVINEPYTIGAVRGRIFAPIGGPFFGNNTVIYDIDNDRELVPRVDYYLIHYYQEAADRSNKPVYAAVRIVNSDVSEHLGFTTQYIGGEFSYSYYAIAEAIRTLEDDGRPVNWGDLVGVPSEFNPTNHLHDIRNSYNWNSVVDALARLEQAVIMGNSAQISLLVQTVEAKLQLIDAFREQISQDVADLRTYIDNALTNYDVTVQQYFTDFRNNLFNYLKSTVIKTGSYTLALNRSYCVYPSNPSTAAWMATLQVPSNVTPVEGDYIEFKASRDGGTLNLITTNAPIRFTDTDTSGNLQLVDLSSVTNLPLDRAGYRLTWDSRSNTWLLSYGLGNLRIDKYDLIQVVTTGEIDLSKGNCFKLDATSGVLKTISLTSLKAGRVKPVTITITGEGPVLWPQNIVWANGIVPQLQPNVTVVTLYLTSTSALGNWVAFPTALLV